jgi:hypothetical protein
MSFFIKKMSQNLWATIMPFGPVTNILLAQRKFFRASQGWPSFQPLQVLQNFSAVFQDNLGSVTGIQANLILKDDAKPVFTTARPLLYAMRPKVEKELDRLEQEGVIFKVPTSDWETPIVPIVKQSGDVRICGVFKVTN